MAVADVPDLELSHVVACRCCLADGMAALLLTAELLHVGCHCHLTCLVVGSGGVGEEHAVVLFDHALSIRGQVGDSRGRVDTAPTVLDVAPQDVVKHIFIIL